MKPDFEKWSYEVLCSVQGHLDCEENIKVALQQAYAAGIEAAAVEAIRVWHEATNERTDNPGTSFMQNSVAHGCMESAKAIRALLGEK